MRNTIHFLTMLLLAVLLFTLQGLWFVLYGIYCKLESHQSRMWWHDNKFNLMQWKEKDWLHGVKHYPTVIHYVIDKYKPNKYVE